MKDKKGYGIVIPNDLSVEKWNKLTPEEILVQLKEFNKEAFYRMAEDAGVDVDLLEKSGYEYDGISELSIIEAESFLPQDKYEELRSLITKTDVLKDEDFNYVLHLYLDGHLDCIKDFYAEETLLRVNECHQYALNKERESLLALKRLFIEEFGEDKTEAKKTVLEEYDGRFIDIPELHSFLSRRMDISWYRGDLIDKGLESETAELNSMKALLPISRMLSEGGEFLLQSTIYSHQKAYFKEESARILSQAIALALKMLLNREPDFTKDPDIYEKYTWQDLIGAEKEIKDIEEDINIAAQCIYKETDLGHFYYLADNAIKWSPGITLTKRYLFLYKLASFFGYFKISAIDDLDNAYVRKDIVDKIKKQVKSFEKKDPDKEILRDYLD